jgi:molybdopterin molybdotransferase
MNDALVTRSAAIERVSGLRETALSTGTERVSIARAAGRTLADPVVASADVPHYDHATMDGYAVAAADEYPLDVVDEVFPESDPPNIERGDAVEIATGAPLPPSTDTVVMREDATVTDGRLRGPSLSPGTNVYPAGATAAAGERLFDAGERLAPRHAALLRDVGVDAVSARCPLDVAVLPTGTEIVEGRQPDRDSEMLANLVRAWGHRPSIVEAVADEESAVRAAITNAAADHDAVLTTGGTSVGRSDHVVAGLADHDLRFRGVALRPGRPVSVATVDATPVVALPGKPVAAHTAATLVARALFTGETRLPTVAADFDARVTVPDDDVEFAIPVTLDDGRATPLGHADSALSLYDERFAPGRVASSTRVTLADGVVLTSTDLDAGERIAVVPYEVVE